MFTISPSTATVKLYWLTVAKVLETQGAFCTNLHVSPFSGQSSHTLGFLIHCLGIRYECQLQLLISPTHLHQIKDLSWKKPNKQTYRNPVSNWLKQLGNACSRIFISADVKETSEVFDMLRLFLFPFYATYRTCFIPRLSYLSHRKVIRSKWGFSLPCHI